MVTMADDQDVNCLEAGCILKNGPENMALSRFVEGVCEGVGAASSHLAEQAIS